MTPKLGFVQCGDTAVRFPFLHVLLLGINYVYLVYVYCCRKEITCKYISRSAVADPGGGGGGHAPPRPVKISHKKDGCQRRLHRFHVSWSPYPAAGSATGVNDHISGSSLRVG